MRPASIDFPRVPEYSDALQNPKKCFRVPELQESAPDLDTRGLPLPIVGGAAAVFKLTPQGAPFALKVFKFDLKHRQQRYQLVSDHLRAVKSSSLVEFTYEEEGIRVPRGTETFGQALWFPFLRMSWVEGLTLNKWVQQKLDQGDRRALAVFAQRFENLIQELKSCGIAHGDLQNGNVMVVNDEPKLVDYDGMYVPKLAGNPSEEFGLPGFQHPLRRQQQEKWWGPDLDDFSAWVIWLTLRAVAADPTTWVRYNAAQSETMLFTAPDLEHPKQSKLWPELLRSPDSEVAARADALFRSLHQPFEIPVFDTDPFRRLRLLCAARPKDYDAIDREAKDLASRKLTPPADLQQDVETARQVATFRGLCQAPVKDYAAIDRAFAELQRLGVALPADLHVEGENARLVTRLRALCAASTKDWDAIARAADELKRRGVTLPSDLQRWADGAGSAAELQRLCSASLNDRDFGAIDLLGGDLKRAGITLTGVLLRQVEIAGKVMYFTGLCAAEPQDFAAISRAAADLKQALGMLPPRQQEMLDEAKQTHELASVLADLESLARSPGDGRQLVQRWQQEQGRVGSHPRGAAVKKAAEQWGRRISESEAFLRLVLPGGFGTEAEVAAAWDRLQQVGGHPDADPYAARAEEAKKRATCLKQLAALSQDEEEEADQRWQQTWDDALLGNCRDAAPYVRPHAEATKRLRLVAGLRKAIAAADQGTGDEQAVLDAAARLPASYKHRSKARVETAGKRIALAQELLRALQAQPPSDTLIAHTWERMGAGEQQRLPSHHVERCKTAVARRDLLDKLRAIPSDPNEQNDQLWQRAWNEDLLQGCHEADPLRPRQAKVARHLALLAALAKAIEAADQGLGEEGAVLDAAAKLPSGYRYKAQTRVESARRRLLARQALKKALETRPRSDSAIASAWDAVDPAERKRLKPEVIARCQKAVERRECLAQVRAIPDHGPEDVQDSTWLARWKPTLLAGCIEAAPLQKRYELARSRADAWQALHKCLQNKDLRRIRELLDDNSLLHNYPPVVQKRAQIEDLLRQADQLDHLEALLRNRMRGLTLADLDFLRNFPPVLDAEKPRVVKALREWLSDHPILPGSTHVSPGSVKWLWPEADLVSHCLVAVGDSPFETPEEAERPTVINQDRHNQYHSRGGYPAASLLFGRQSGWVTVWAVIDLGWARVVGPPLHLNPFRPGGGSGAGRAGRGK